MNSHFNALLGTSSLLDDISLILKTQTAGKLWVLGP